MVTFTQKHIGCAEALELPPPSCPVKPVVLVAAAVIIDRDGRILVAQRPEGKAMAGLWEFPGGKIEEGELPEYALMRELREELAIETRPCCFTPVAFASHSYDQMHLLMPVFACRVWKGTVRPQEGQAVKWLYPVDLYSLEMPPADLPLLPQIEAAL